MAQPRCIRIKEPRYTSAASNQARNKRRYKLQEAAGAFTSAEMHWPAVSGYVLPFPLRATPEATQLRGG